jgi:hypothetical protein
MRETERGRISIKVVLPSPVRTLGVAGALIVLCAARAAAQSGTGVVLVDVTDSSGARLPGVAVVATSLDGHAQTAVTDGTGHCVFPAVPAGPVMLRLRLAGFTGALVGTTVEPGVETNVAQRLEIAPVSETVVVEAPAPADPPRPPPPPPAPPPPPRGPLIRPVPPHERDSVCGPAKAGAATAPPGTIRSTRYVADGGLYTTGAQITVDGGTINGLEVGQNFVVRRYFRVHSLTGTEMTGEHSAGLVQIAAVSERSSIAHVVYACDELRAGDFLAPFNAEPIRAAEPRGTPDYDNAARILFADEGQLLAAPRRMMVIDRGSANGLRVGQRLTLFRRRSARPDVVGDAVIVAIRGDSATIRIERVNDAIASGDLAAPE